MQQLPFLAAMITAIAVENVVFIRALGMDKSVLYLNSPKQGILYGGVLTWMVTISSLLVSLVITLLQGNPYVDFVRAPAFLVCVGLVYCMSYYTAKQKLPEKLYRMIRPYLPFATFNSALFGAFFVAAVGNFTFAQTTGYALGTGIGYTLAILVIYYARKRLAISPVPRSFRGLPILLIYIGLLSLALIGILGYSLPT